MADCARPAVLVCGPDVFFLRPHLEEVRQAAAFEEDRESWCAFHPVSCHQRSLVFGDFAEVGPWLAGERLSDEQVENLLTKMARTSCHVS